MHTYAGMHFTALCTHTLGSWQPWLEQVYLSQQRREKNGNLLIIDVLVFLRCCGFVNQYQQVSLPILHKVSEILILKLNQLHKGSLKYYLLLVE